jgi:spore coat protein A
MGSKRSRLLGGVTGSVAITTSVLMANVFAQPLPGGTLDPLTIPKYVTPLVIPPVMNDTGTAGDYDIAVRQFQQQILPGGIWGTLPGCSGQNCTFPATTVWSYGPDADPTPVVAPAVDSQFNYPAYTIENLRNSVTTVDWINDLVADPDACNASVSPATDPACNFVPHLLPIDRTLHWANPEQLPCMDPAKTKDCRPDPASGAILQQPYDGPVPIVTHVHGAHVGPESDGYPEAWWLPDASNIPAGYATTGTLVNQYGTPTNNVPGVASFSYPNDQPSTTLWYHDHSLGMTRNNVYAGPAGFWLIRDAGGVETGLRSGTLPGPAPVAGQGVLALNVPGDPVRASIREIPIVIQDRSFNLDGSLFYPDNRAFFEGLSPNQLRIPLIGDPANSSDIAPIWNPEAFFNVMVVNGVSWPSLEVEPDLYRFRLLNGCNSRFLNLSLRALDANGAILGEVPFYQIGAEQSLLPNVVKVTTGFKTVLRGNGQIPRADTPAAAVDEALLMGLAERADVIVDFSNLPAGTVKVRMINTAPDAPFGGFPDIPADPSTTGQVMEFAVVADTAVGEGFTAPEDLRLRLPDRNDPATRGIQATVRDLALIEEESVLVCATVAPNGAIQFDRNSAPDPANPGTCVDKNGQLALSLPFAPKAAVLGTNGAGGGTVTLWSDPIATNPALNATETWELWNHTVDGHPIHLHLVKFKVVNREAFDPATLALTGVVRPPEATEAGWKDTVIAYPGEVTRVSATFDIEGLYVWHCHIVEHEDNEMMVPYCVGDKATAPGCGVVP